MIIVGLGIAVAATRPSAIEAGTQCRRGDLVSTHTLIVIDRTEAWSDNQISLLRAALAAHARAAKRGDRLTLVPFDGFAEHPPEPLFDKCKAHDPRETNPLFETVPLVEQAYRTDFAQPLAASIAKITQSKGSPATHLVAFLASIGSHLAYQQTATHLHVVLYSDLAENTPQYSMLPRKSRLPFTAATFTKHFNAIVGERLRSITLDIRVLPTPGIEPDLARRIKAAWSHALSSNGISFTIKDL